MRRVAVLAGTKDQPIGPNQQATTETFRNYFSGIFHNADAERMPNENKAPTFEGLNPLTLFREFAAECMELAQMTPTPEKRALYLKMASMWFQMVQRWERGVLSKNKKTLPRCPKCNDPMRAVEYATFNCVPCEITLSYGNHEDEVDG
jgi:hypothetical protein